MSKNTQSVLVPSTPSESARAESAIASSISRGAVADLIQRGKSAEGRIRAIMGERFAPGDASLRISGKGDARKVAGLSVKGRRYDESALQSLSVGDAECWPAYVALVTLAQYLETPVTAIAVQSAS